MADTQLKVIDQGLRTLLYTKFGTIMGITSMVNDTAIFPKEIAMRKVAEKRGDVSMEFISVWRERTNLAKNRSTTALARDGLNMSYVDPVTKLAISNVKAVAVDLDYSIRFWSKDNEKLNQVIEEYLLWRYSNPNLDLIYNTSYPMQFDLRFNDVNDESPVIEMFDRGLYFVVNCPVHVDGWSLFPTTVKSVKKIIVSLYDDETSDNANVLISTNTYTFTP